MYTLEKVLELIGCGSDVYCLLYRTDRYIGEGWLSDIDLDPDTKIEMYRLESVDDCLVLHLA